MRKKRRSPPFVMLPREMLKSPEWKSLTPYEHDVYTYLKAGFNGSNNGDIVLTYKSLDDCMSPATASKAFRGLESKGWIRKKQIGGLYRRINKFELTGKYDPAIHNYGG